MLVITDAGVIEGQPPDRLSKIKSRPLIGLPALRLTRWLRAVNAERYMNEGKTHLDIGCGDGYLLFRSRYETRYGLDLLMGDDAKDRLDFPDETFDLVTMLAVIEHMLNVREVLEEIHRVLKPGGKLVLTTPRESAEWIIQLYAPHIGDVHEIYFDYDSMGEIAAGLFEIEGYHSFIFGLNQAFSLTKLAH